MQIHFEKNDVTDTVIKKAWEDEDFKEQLLNNPKEALNKEFNINLPEFIELKVVEEAKNSFYIVIPVKPEISSDIVTIECNDEKIKPHW